MVLLEDHLFFSFPFKSRRDGACAIAGESVKRGIDHEWAFGEVLNNSIRGPCCLIPSCVCAKRGRQRGLRGWGADIMVNESSVSAYF